MCLYKRIRIFRIFNKRREERLQKEPNVAFWCWLGSSEPWLRQETGFRSVFKVLSVWSDLSTSVWLKVNGKHSLNSALDEDCVGWLEKQRSLDLTLSHVMLTTVDILTCYFFRLCLVFCSTLWCLESWTKLPFSWIKGLSDLVSPECVLHSTGNHSGRTQCLFNEYMQTRLNT